jgi:hypothetical protein
VHVAGYDGSGNDERAVLWANGERQEQPSAGRSQDQSVFVK